MSLSLWGPPTIFQKGQRGATLSAQSSVVPAALPGLSVQDRQVGLHRKPYPLLEQLDCSTPSVVGFSIDKNKA